jgi:hypothetical protein
VSGARRFSDAQQFKFVDMPAFAGTTPNVLHDHKSYFRDMICPSFAFHSALTTRE